MVWVFCLNDYGPVWSPSSNNSFHISNTLTDISTHFFTHTNFKKFQKISNNNSQTHLPNGPYFTGFSYFFFVGLQMKFLVKRASVYELQCREGIPNVLGCDFQALFSILKKIENFCFFVFNLDADIVIWYYFNSHVNINFANYPSCLAIRHFPSVN